MNYLLFTGISHWRTRRAAARSARRRVKVLFPAPRVDRQPFIIPQWIVVAAVLLALVASITWLWLGLSL